MLRFISGAPKRTFFLLVLLIAFGGRGFAQGLNPSKLASLKAATALVLVRTPGFADEGGSGSGFLFRKDGDTGFFATNAHVVEVSRGVTRRVSVVLNSGVSGKEHVLVAEVISEDSSRDLAILRVHSDDLPEPLPPITTAVAETTPIFVFGFPFGEELTTGRLHPAITVSTGAVSSIRIGEDGGVERVQINADINPGNSGGPVVTAGGEVVGIATEKIEGTEIGLAVPTSQLEALLVGRVKSLDFDLASNMRGVARYKVVVTLLDPLDAVRAVSLWVLSQSAQPTPKGDAIGVFSGPISPLMSEEKLDIHDKVARGEFELHVDKEAAFWVQSRLESRDGTIKWTQPTALTVDQGFLAPPTMNPAPKGSTPNVPASIGVGGSGWLGNPAPDTATGATSSAKAEEPVHRARAVLGEAQVVGDATARALDVPGGPISCGLWRFCPKLCGRSMGARCFCWMPRACCTVSSSKGSWKPTRCLFPARRAWGFRKWAWSWAFQTTGRCGCSIRKHSASGARFSC